MDVDDTEENDELAHKVIRGVCSPFFRVMRDLRHHTTSLTTFQVLLYLTTCLIIVLASEVTLLEKLILSMVLLSLFVEIKLLSENSTVINIYLLGQTLITKFLDD